MCKYNLHTDKVNNYFISDPFSKREAFCWLLENSNSNEIRTSIRSLAQVWKWHRSRVERFLKTLKDIDVIDTDIKVDKTIITIVNTQASQLQSNVITETKRDTNRDSFDAQSETHESHNNQGVYLDQYLCIETLSRQDQDSSELTETKQDSNRDTFDTQGKMREALAGIDISQYEHSTSETLSRQNQDSFKPIETAQNSNRDTFDAHDKMHESLDNPHIHEVQLLETETLPRQNQDSFEFLAKIKKEKNQKKETKTLKEKILSFREYKKEKVSKVLIEDNPLIADSVSKFAEDLGITSQELNWELEKFRDYQLSRHRKPLIDPAPAFRNWLRRSVEFKQRGSYVQHNQNKPTSFERFLAGSIRAVAEFEQRRLDREAVWNYTHRQ